MTEFTRGDIVRLKKGKSCESFRDTNLYGYYLGTHQRDMFYCQLQIPGFGFGHDGTGGRFSSSRLEPMPGIKSSGTDIYNVPIDILELVTKADQKTSEFKIGDRVKIKSGDKSDGKIGTIVKNYYIGLWTVKIPGFDGHSGDIEDGTKDKWYASEENLTKLPDSTKIEFKSQSQEIEEKIPTTGVTQTKEKEKKMFNINFSELLTKNKELAIQEAQRQAGKIVFEHLYDLPVIQNLPESIKGFLKTAVGKFIVANLVKTVSTFYTGPNQDKIEFITDSLLRGALSDLGDSFNINKIFSDLTSKVAHLIPGESKE